VLERQLLAPCCIEAGVPAAKDLVRLAVDVAAELGLALTHALRVKLRRPNRKTAAALG
jgi:hypothetical protein